MDRALRRLDEPADPPRRGRRRLWPSPGVLVVLALIVVAGLLITYSGMSFSHLPNVSGSGVSNASNTGRTTVISNAPTTNHLASQARLLPAPAGVPVSHAYKTLHRDLFNPVTWEPCRAIHYVVRRGEEPRRFDDMLEQAIAAVSRATGLKFVNDGTTAELMLRNPDERLAYQPRLYGDRWAPVLISWSDPSESPELAGTIEGFGGPVSWAPPGGPLRYVSGTVAYNVPHMTQTYREPHGAVLVRDILLHELGHLVGLAHISDRGQIMYPEVIRPLPGYAAGDLAGLAKLGDGNCYPDY